MTSSTPADRVGSPQHSDAVLGIAASFVRALDYSPPSFPQDPVLRAAAVEELQSWNLGNSSEGLLKYLDIGIAAAELFYPSHGFDLKLFMSICTACITWIDSVAESIVDALAEFQRRFYSGLPQLHPVLGQYAKYTIKLYDHYEDYVAGAMIMSFCGFVDVNCLEARAVIKRVPAKSDAKLWPYYIRNLSGISVFYAFACFPKKDHPDLARYVQAIPEMLIFTNFLNDVLSFYKEDMDGEETNYCQMMSKVSGQSPIDVLDDVAREAVSVAKRAEAILEGSSALKVFKEYQQGYIRFHLDVGRYRLPAAWKAQFTS